MTSSGTRSGPLADQLRRVIRDVPDFPKSGIVFKDITPILLDAALFHHATEAMAAPFAADAITHVIGIESRGFILGAPVAQHLGAAFVPVRKPGKLPSTVERVQYALEMHRDALGSGDRALIVDDVLATGGTARATCELVERIGARVVGCSFLMTLSFLPGVQTLAARRVESLIEY